MLEHASTTGRNAAEVRGESCAVHCSRHHRTSSRQPGGRPTWLAVTALATAILAAPAAEAAPVFQGLGHLPGGNDSRPYAISADGRTVVGRADTGNSTQAFVWTPQEGIASLPHEAGATASTGRSVAADGHRIVGLQRLGAQGNEERLWVNNNVSWTGASFAQ